MKLTAKKVSIVFESLQRFNDNLIESGAKVKWDTTLLLSRNKRNLKEIHQQREEELTLLNDSTIEYDDQGRPTKYLDGFSDYNKSVDKINNEEHEVILQTINIKELEKYSGLNPNFIEPLLDIIIIEE